jgi:predicted DNA-binding ribbon-helix-helix protein
MTKDNTIKGNKVTIIVQMDTEFYEELREEAKERNLPVDIMLHKVLSYYFLPPADKEGNCNL